MNCEGLSNEAGLGRSSNQRQDGSRVGRGEVGVAVSRLGMWRWQLTRTGMPSATLRDGWQCGQQDGSLSCMAVAWVAVWTFLSLASHCLCLASLFSFLFSFIFRLFRLVLDCWFFFFFFYICFFLDLHGLLTRLVG